MIQLEFFEAIQVIDPGFSIRDVLKSYVENLEPKVSTTLSPSTLGHCPRTQLLRYRGVKSTTPPDEATLINFQVGFAWELIIKKALDEQGIEYKFQVPLESKELNLAGTADFLIKQPDGVVVVDAKTMRSKWFWYLAKTNKDFLTQNPEYRMQLGAYVLMARENGLEPLRGQLAFISKDDGMIWREVSVELTPELETEIRARCQMLNNLIKSGDLPPCECEGWKVGYCPMGNPNTKIKNAKGKLINSECCSETLWKEKS